MEQIRYNRIIMEMISQGIGYKRPKFLRSYAVSRARLKRDCTAAVLMKIPMRVLYKTATCLLPCATLNDFSGAYSTDKLSYSCHYMFCK